MIYRLFNCLLCLTLFAFSKPSLAQQNQVTLVFAGEMPLINNTQTGDYPELANLLKKVRNKDSNTSFLFSGGSLGPSPMSAFDRGSHIIDILNTLEPDAMAVSKREFSYFEEELSLRSYEAAFPLLTSNVTVPKTGNILDGLTAQMLIEKGGLKIGLISVLDQTVVEEYLLTRVDVSEPESAIINHAQSLRDLGADFIVLMYSENLPFIDQFLQQQTIDLALLTDPHFALSLKDMVPSHPNSVYLTEAGEAAEVTIAWQGQEDKTFDISWQTHRLKEQGAEPKVQMQIAEYRARLDRLLDEQVGVLATPMDTRREVVRAEESAFANFVADSLKDFFDTDIAIINGGVIRGERRYEANTTLTRRDIATELPFRSRIVIVELSGKALKQAIENGLSMIEEYKGRFLHLSGVSIVFDSKAEPGQRIKQVLVNGGALEDGKLYKVATSDYLASGGDEFTMLKQAKVIELNTRVAPLLSEIVINQIRQQRQITPKVEGRLVDMSKEVK